MDGVGVAGVGGGMAGMQHSLSVMDSMSDAASEREDDSGIESSAPDPQDNTVFIRIGVPELKVQKCLQFQLDDTVWMAKQRVLSSMARELKDGLNYGLYSPPVNGRAGKFLEEERPLRDYPLPGPIGFLEFKYKRRVYKLMQLNPRKLKQLHTKANLKQFMAAVRAHNVDNASKFTTRGLDPNFQEHDTGETPLTVASQLDKPRNMLIALVSGGYHIDYRTRGGLTALHRAAQKNNYEAVKTLLDLGASTNYKDAHGLTPLYHAVVNDTVAPITESLLHDHSALGITDEQGWTEIHQACKAGRVQHLEHLLFYGAEMNAQNSSGNTSLHVCAASNQESCARVLLFRGADKTIQNFANQDAFQVAVIAGNSELAEIIRHFRPEDVVPFQEVPKYNDKRRPTLAGTIGLHRSRSDPRLNVAGVSGAGLFLRSNSSSGSGSKPPSPALSNNSLPQYVSNGNLFESSGAGMLYRGHHYDSDSPRSMSISDTGSCSGLSVNSSRMSDVSSASVSRRSSVTSADLVQSRRSSIGSEALASIKNTLMSKFSYLRRSSIVSEGGHSSSKRSSRGSGDSLWISDRTAEYQRKCSTLPDNRRTTTTKSATLPDNFRAAVASHEMARVEARRSCTSIPESAMGYMSSRRRLYAATPGRTFVCVKSYRPQEEGELRMRKGSFVEVISVGEGGYWEGKIGEREGWFPADHVQEVRLRRAAGSRGYGDEDSILIKRQTLAALTKSDGEFAPRTIVLQKGRSGFGFVLRGAKAQMSHTQALEFTPTQDFPALQYLDRVDKGSMADKAGLKPGDFLLEINGESVVNATHEHTVRLIKHSGDTLAMKVITVRPMVRDGLETRDIHADGTMTLPLKKKGGPPPPKRDPKTFLSQSGMSRSFENGLDRVGHKGKAELTLTRHRDADTVSLTHGPTSPGAPPAVRSPGARRDFHRDAAPDPIIIPPAVSRKLDNQANKTASIRSRTSASRLTSVELDDLFSRQPALQQEPTSPRERGRMANGSVVVPAQNRPSPRTPQSQMSVERSRSRSQSDSERGQGQGQRQNETYTRHITRVDIGEPESPANSIALTPRTQQQFEFPDHRLSNGRAERDTNIYATPSIDGDAFDYVRSGVHLPLPSSVIPPPPSEPAPKPPGPRHGEVVEINTNSPGYANVSNEIVRRQNSRPEPKEDSPYESSFRPGKGARLSKTPADLPVNRSRHSSNYSGSGSGGSGSEPSENRHFSAHKHVMAYEKHSASSESGSEKQSVSFAEDKVFENAAKFVQDHPDATVLVTSDSRRESSERDRFFEPTPDYDHEETDTVKRRPVSHERSPAGRPPSTGSAKVETEVPPVRSLREQWQKRDGTSPARQQSVTSPTSPSPVSTPPAPVQRQTSVTRPQVRPPPPPSPVKEEPSMSDFGNAIKEAALAREKRAQEQDEREALRMKEKHERERREAQAREAEERARRDEEARRRQASLAPPPPPAVGAPAAPIETRKSHTPPPHVQKQLEENRKREQGHNQLMAAIAKRRNYIDNIGSDSDPTGSDIEARIERSKSNSPARVLKADQQNLELVREVTPPKAVAPLPPSSSVASSRRSSLKREAPQPPSPVKPQAPTPPALPREQESKQEEVQVPPAATDLSRVDTLTARAERARQEWLRKKQAGTATLEKQPKKEHVPKQNTDDEDNNNVTKEEEDDDDDDKKKAKDERPGYGRPSRGPPRGDPNPQAERAVSPSRGGLGDLASIIAQKALQRQKTYEGDIEKEAGGPRGNQIVYGSQRSENSNGNDVPNGQDNVFQKLNRSQRNSIEITGATLDSSNTETTGQGQASNKASVLQRTKMFEAQTNNNGSSYSVKSVTRTNGSNPVNNPAGDLPFDLPPPLVLGKHPSSGSVSGSNYDRLSRRGGGDSDVVSNRSSMNGNETVGWVINSSPPSHSHEFAVRRKLANRNGSNPGGVDVGGAGDDVAQVAVVDQRVAPALADIVEVEVIPPPPLFDTDSDALGPGVGVLPTSNFQTQFSHEDNASMVSSLSTLSTLSSNEHDNQLPHDGTYQSHIQTQLSSPSSGYHSASVSQPDDLYSDVAPQTHFEVAPPPPGFDDGTAGAPAGYVDIQQEHHYEELGTIQEFIPPPCGFDSTAAEPTSIPGLRKISSGQRASLQQRFEDKNIRSWSVNDVVEWLDSLNLSAHKQTFLRHQVTGRDLTQMGRNELIALGVTQVGDRMNIERAVKRALMNK